VPVGALEAWKEGECLGLLTAPEYLVIEKHKTHLRSTTAPSFQCISNTHGMDEPPVVSGGPHVLKGA
jgi:hypothetical protein